MGVNESFSNIQEQWKSRDKCKLKPCLLCVQNHSSLSEFLMSFIFVHPISVGENNFFRRNSIVETIEYFFDRNV